MVHQDIKRTILFTVRYMPYHPLLPTALLEQGKGMIGKVLDMAKGSSSHQNQ